MKHGRLPGCMVLPELILMFFDKKLVDCQIIAKFTAMNHNCQIKEL